MATQAAQSTQSAPFAKGSIIWEKKGPLPVWAWALIVLGLVLAVTMWRRNSAASTAAPAPVSPGNTLPNQAAPPIFIMPQGPAPNVTINPTITRPDAPPGSGRPNPPATPAPPPAPTPAAPPNVPTWVNVKKGWIVDDWIGGLQAAGNNVYWNQIATWNPNIGDNVTKSNDPRQRVFRYDTAYKVRP